MALASLVPGTTFAHDYTVVSLIAAGGMGAVYRAHQRSTGNTVALKIMLPEMLADAKNRVRFEDEARISGRIKSSHVVKVLAAGIEEATQTPWLAMEFLTGESLAAFAKPRGALAPEMVLAVLQQVGHALGAAHAAGVVHCDLNPENIFITESQTVGVPFEVKVLDFGISRILKDGRDSATVTTAVGSPHWLAPEQGSKGKTVSPPTDVWSFGLIAFWMLTGRSYWLNANLPDDDFNIYALLGEIAGRDEIVAPSRRLRALGETRSLLSADFDAWFARCVDRDVSRRFVGGREATEGLFEALGAAGGAGLSGPRLSLAPPPVKSSAGVTRELTVGVPGLAPEGYAALGGGTALMAERTAPGKTTAVKKDHFRVVVVEVALVVVLGLVGCAAALNRDSSGQAAPVVAATVVESAPSPVVTPPRVLTCPEGMALIPAGTFSMGDADTASNTAQPPHLVTLSAFCMDLTEVTVAAYRSCVVAGSCVAESATVNFPGITEQQRRDWSPACQANHTNVDQHPINCVNWDQAQAFCRFRGGQLPTEAQWEYAARGTDGRMYPWGNAAPASQLCWSGVTQRTSTCPVQSYPGGNSPFGLFDMAGSVWEWTSDFYASYTETAAIDPIGPPSGTNRVYRGGSWYYTSAALVRAAVRFDDTPLYRGDSIGFRCSRGAI